MTHSTDSKVIVALDYNTAAAAERFVADVSPDLCKLKVGKELFTRSGPQFVTTLVNRGFDVFLDLKFHDIPNTVAAAVKVAADLGVWMTDVHASGGRRMMEDARLASDQSGTNMLLIAVTVLTSFSSEDLAEVWKQFASGDSEVFSRMFLTRAAVTDLDPFDLYYGTEIRHSHTDNFLVGFDSLINLARNCDTVNIILDSLIYPLMAC